MKGPKRAALTQKEALGSPPALVDSWFCFRLAIFLLQILNTPISTGRGRKNSNQFPSQQPGSLLLCQSLSCHQSAFSICSCGSAQALQLNKRAHLVARNVIQNVPRSLPSFCEHSWVQFPSYFFISKHKAMFQDPQNICSRNVLGKKKLNTNNDYE